MNLPNRVDALSFRGMTPTLLDGDDRKAIGQALSVLAIALTALATVAIAGAGILGLAVRTFQLVSG